VINLKSEIKFWMQVRLFLSDYILHCRLSRSDACGWFDSEKVSDIWQSVLRVIKLNEDFGAVALIIDGAQANDEIKFGRNLVWEILCRLDLSFVQEPTFGIKAMLHCSVGFCWQVMCYLDHYHFKIRFVLEA
jgi:hypothetical protein